MRYIGQDKICGIANKALTRFHESRTVLGAYCSCQFIEHRSRLGGHFFLLRDIRTNFPKAIPQTPRNQDFLCLGHSAQLNPDL